MLREGDDDPERRLEVVHAHIERRVLVLSEHERVLREPEAATVHNRGQSFR